MRGGDEDVAQPVAIGADLGPDPLLVYVEQTLLVDHLDGHRLMTVGHHRCARRDWIGHVIEKARGVPTATQQISVPAAVVIAVDVRITLVVVTVVLGVGVRLLERELPGPVVLRRVSAVGGIAARHVAKGGRREVRYRRAGAKVRRRAMVVVPVIAAGGGQQHRRGGKSRFQCRSNHENGEASSKLGRRAPSCASGTTARTIRHDHHPLHTIGWTDSRRQGRGGCRLGGREARRPVSAHGTSTDRRRGAGVKRVL